MRILCLVIFIILNAMRAGAADPPAAPAPATIAPPLIIPGVQNAFHVSDRIYSGSQPESDEAFAVIAKLGVKTIVSVDGNKPDVAAAHRHGLRYVHLPFGYDGVPTNRVIELAQLMASGAGPFYVHCHHGKHRGPTAVAVMCLADKDWTPDQAVAWLHEAGTADDYPGLYRTAREFTAPTHAQMAAVKPFPEIAQTPSLVDAMVAIDAGFDHLKAAQKAGWKTPLDHPDATPAHEATLLWEQFREITRMEAFAERPVEFREKLTEAVQLTDSLRRMLQEATAAPTLDTAWKQIGQTCAACHKHYRNK